VGQLNVAEALGEEEECYEDDFDDDFEEEEEEEEEEDLYGEGGNPVVVVPNSALSVGAQSAGGQRVGEQRPVSAKCSDALDFKRRQQGLEHEDIVEEAAGLEYVEKDVDEEAFVRHEIAEETDGDNGDAETFEAAAISAQVWCAFRVYSLEKVVMGSEGGEWWCMCECVCVRVAYACGLYM
jgi:hypothetical protein